ncbi:hypothetical protein Agub_g7511 [Astrephomene gubernaculifera]|uniref:TAZ-type domain-containing protein n=1 Tax=Astrephomene gubernaculifera TaxID=47775 RepID=A0AAD3HMC5_9CHLO|nr:hypothetical protein Agub_g7511 [Astrephomene gubernaculifera]
MDGQATEDLAVANAANWLRLTFHALTCNDSACCLGERCSGGKLLLSHILASSSPDACTAAVPQCTSVRRLVLHWLECQEPNCRLCAGVWRDISGYQEQHEGHVRLSQDRGSDTVPPEQPGTPQRGGSPEPVDMDFHTSAFAGNAVGRTMATISPAGAETPANPANRAVLQLQDVTSYMRYLLHTLMRKQSSGDTASRAAGRMFWLEVLRAPALQPQQQQQWTACHPVMAAADGGMGAAMEEAGGATGAGGGSGAGGGAYRYLEPPSAAPTLAGRRLVMHRLMCRNPYCALCAGTCELFTRGHALTGDLRAPQTMRDMDNIVQELSLALAWFQL